MNKLLQSMMLSQVNTVGSSIQALQQVTEMGYVGCGGPHNTDACSLNTKYVAYVKSDFYSNMYNEG